MPQIIFMPYLINELTYQYLESYSNENIRYRIHATVIVEHATIYRCRFQIRKRFLWYRYWTTGPESLAVHHIELYPTEKLSEKLRLDLMQNFDLYTRKLKK